jgi:hypothetical protein
MFIFAANNENHEMYSTAVLLSMHVYIAVVLSSIPAITTVQNGEIYA